ncbi:dihydroxy-acid dehydratase [Klebsiella pneumoniae subsp. pneumoniae]|nr:dihydroxy-acid dehydratase [Klebsiella pneumoniae subsp. pneumoniae]
MTLDIAMGGSTNTVLHLLAAAQEAEIDFTMSAISISSPAKVLQLCKVAPSTQKYHMEDAPRRRRAGHSGRAGPRRAAESRGQNVLGLTLPQTLEQYDVMVTQDDAVKKCSAPARRASVPPRRSRKTAAGIPWMTIAPKAVSGSLEHAYSKDGGLAVLCRQFRRKRLYRENRRRGRQHPEIYRSGESI